MNHFLADNLKAAERKHEERTRQEQAALDRDLLKSLLMVGFRCGDDDAEMLLDLLVKVVRNSMWKGPNG